MIISEKKQELLLRYRLIFDWATHADLSKVVKCTLVCVDEILDILNHDLGHDETAQGLSVEFEEIKEQLKKQL